MQVFLFLIQSYLSSKHSACIKKSIKTSELCGFFRHLRIGVLYVNILYNHLIFVECADIHFVNVSDFIFIGKLDL